jgi:putative flippase GtrA
MPLRDLIDRYGGKALRYSAVSAVGVTVTQVLIVVFYKGLDWKAWVANFAAVTISSGPAYLLNRQWVWGKNDEHSVTREVLPFWGMSLLGLLLSTGGVAIVSNYTDATIAVSATNIAAFGVLWVGKFMILEHVLFRGEHVSVAAAEPFVAPDPSDITTRDDA